MHQMEQRLCSRLDTQDKTLRDVINHMSHMEQRLTARLDQHDKRFDTLEKRLFSPIDGLEMRLTIRIDDLEENLTRRINALDEDLTATILDTIVIRKFVGMPVPEEG
ncbi:MAG: hypothetical protein Greene041662_923 [Candidatus Peregrinibacteria bacterium Greene0416_62]|nr:MAG: hypothetical protein Greene041662_923 [Candidatus Peregrinibacteria bacterium Greene0416_62]TSD00491.1 MAG: hypothetical protein Greene101449_101 [Candidatus Peregrinibacteria bacterium Greene1014_49]